MIISTPEQKQAPARRRSWARWGWLWGWAPLVVVLGWVVMRWYDTTPARYVPTSYGPVMARSWHRSSNGVLLEEADRTYVYRDLEGRELWRVVAPTIAVGRSYINPWGGPGSEADHVEAVSPDGHVCAIALAAKDDWVVYTWQDGKRIGTVHVGMSDLSFGYCFCCADDGTVFLTAKGTEYDPWGAVSVRGNQEIGHGSTGNFVAVSSDVRTLIRNEGFPTSICCYGHVKVSGQVLSVTWDPAVFYDGRYGTLCDGNPLLTLRYNRWESYSQFTKLGVSVTGSSRLPPPSGATSIVRVYHQDTGIGWTVTAPHNTTVAMPTDDDQHVLIGNGTTDATRDPWEHLRIWPVRYILPWPTPQINLSLYNRAGKCEALLSYAQLTRLFNNGAYVDARILDISPDGRNLVLCEAMYGKVFFLRAEQHATVWETVAGWMGGKQVK